MSSNIYRLVVAAQVNADCVAMYKIHIGREEETDTKMDGLL